MDCHNWLWSYVSRTINIYNFCIIKGEGMSKEKIALCEDLADIMPPEYHELVENATYCKQDRGW